MRQIKFRVWDETTDEMFYELGDFHVSHEGDLRFGYDAGREHPTVGHGDWVELVLMQFTGLTDKNGKEIYEGDILRNEDDKGNYSISFVVWCLDGWRFNSYMICGQGLYENVNKQSSKPIAEVIGNIHQNPDLLK